MSYVRVWIHSVWGTKNREPFLSKEIRPKVIDHIRENAKKKQIYIDKLNGYTDHLHCLFGLNADTAISKTLQLIKGESAFWVNKERVTPMRFEWADEYYAVSVSEADLDSVRSYIDNQEQHHRKGTFAEEVSELLKSYKFLNQR
ncbi:MAG: IS200/IS605 family transposase [Ignavibacteriales bacterium]|nr:IS200/IS605 family transposase [Ignavibacteriales bacterium]